jgi:hypothetical protein
MKKAWKEEISLFEDEQKRNVTKGDFTKVFGRAYVRSFTPESVKAAFEITGVHPYNPNVIQDKQTKPSLTTSTKGPFPLPQASPVRAVMAAFSTYPTTAFDAESSPIHPDQLPDHTERESRSTDRRRHIDDTDIDPHLFTPSKRMRALVSGLSATSSGSILVSDVKATSSSIRLISPVLEAPPALPEPDWGLVKPTYSYMTRDQLAQENEQLRKSLINAQMQMRARDAMLEGSHAQLVLQNLTLQKTHQAFFNKENWSKNDRTLLFDGKAQVLSSDDFTDKVSNATERREAEITRRVENAQRRQSRKEIQAQLEEEWKQIKTAHETAIEEWSAQCQNLKDQGVPKKNWPKKPTRPRKPKSPMSDQAAGDSGNEDNGAEGDGDHDSDA